MSDAWKELAGKYDALQVGGSAEPSAPVPSGPPQKIGAEAFQDTLRAESEGANPFVSSLAGAGTALSNLYQGAKQLIGMGDPQAIQNNRTLADAAPVGAFLGNVALAAPTAMIPGANTIPVSGAIGAGIGMLQPTQGDESRLMNTAIGAAAGAGGQWGAGKIADVIRGRAAAAQTKALADNSARTPLLTTLNDAKGIGMVVPPSSVNPSPMNRAIEAISGKYATQNEASLRNQEATNAAVRRALGLPEGTPLTEATLDSFRASRAVPYQQVAALGDIPTLGYNPGSLGPSVKGNTQPGFMNLSQTKIPGAGNINTADAVERLKELRFASKEQWKFYGRSGDPEARQKAEAIGQAAESLEGWLEKAAAYAGKPDLIKELRAARVDIAKSHDIERALTDASGNVSAKDLAKSKYLTGELKKIAQFAEAFPTANRTPESIGSPVTLVDAGMSALFGLGGATASGGPAGAIAAAGWPLARVAAKNAVLSRPYQSAMATVPQASVPTTLRLSDLLLQAPLARGMVPALSSQGVLGAKAMFE